MNQSSLTIATQVQFFKDRHHLGEPDHFVQGRAGRVECQVLYTESCVGQGLPLYTA